MASHPTPARLEAFSDGVIAVIITIMVLEFKVPAQPGPAGLLPLLPTFLVYALSFVLVGVYWVNHHYMVDRLRYVDGPVLWSNLFFLFTLSLLPFFTQYLISSHRDGWSVALYAASLLLDGLAFQLASIAIRRNLCRHGEPESAQDLDELRAEFHKGIASLLLYAVSIALARWHPRLAMLPIALVTPLWIVPRFLLHRSDGTPRGRIAE